MSTLTVLFTDLVGSTALMGKLGADRFDQLLTEHDALVNTAITAHDGQWVKHTGDGVMAVFTGATEALNAAVAIQQAVDRRNRRTDVEFMVRVGLGVGDVTEKHGDYFGTPAVEAARLCAAAGAGQILASEIVKVLAGSRGDHEFLPLGNLELKGLPPLATVEVRWDQAGQEPRVPLPAAFAREDRAELIGRDAELTQLLDAWERTAQGARGVVMLSGEPGIGKSRLATELARRAHAQGAAVLLGRCEDGFGAPYKPFGEIIAGAMTLDPGELTDWAERHGSDVSRISRTVREKFQEIAEADGADPDTARNRTCEGVEALLAAISRTGPVLVVLDDLHWADEASLLLLRYLARAEPEVRVMLLGTYRDADSGTPLADTLADVRRAIDLVHVSVRGLSDADIREFVTQLSSDDPDARLLDAVSSDTEGNPFFVIEAVAHYEESGEVGASEGVRQLIGQRLGRLSESTQRMFGTAAVIGREFDLALLATVTGDDEDTLLDQLDEARATGLVNERAGQVGRFGFSHALVTATLVDGLGATRRIRLHQRVGEAIETRDANDLDAHLSELAHHFGEAAAAAPTKAASYAVRVGRQARLVGSTEEGLTACRRALQILDALPGLDDALRFDALLEYAWCTSAIDPPQAIAPLEEALDLARRLGSYERVALVAGIVPQLTFSRVVTPRLRATLDEALGAVAPDDITMRAELLAARAFSTVFSNPSAAQAREAEEQAREAVELAQRAGGHHALYRAFLALHETLWIGPRAAEALAAAQQMLADVRSVGLHSAWQNAQWRTSRSHLRLADRHGASMVYDSDPESRSDSQGRSFLRAALAIAEGRWADATQAADAHRDQFPNNSAVGLTHFEQHSRIRSEQGRTNASLFTRLAADFPEFPAVRAEAALATAEAGEHSSAAELLEPLAADDFAAVPHDSGRTLVLRQLSELVAHVGTPDHARTLHSMLAPYDGQILIGYTGSSIEGAAARGLGQLETVLGRYDEAAAHYEAAIALEQHLGAPVCLARTRYWYARALLARGDGDDTDRAAALLDEVIAETSRLGMTAIEAQARQLR